MAKAVKDAAIGVILTGMGWDGAAGLSAMRDAGAATDLVKRAAQFGANNYLVKPFTVATLKEKIETVFGALT